jgi:endonuclease-3
MSFYRFYFINRISLTENAKTPLEAEKQLTRNIPDHDIPDAHHWHILLAYSAWALYL